MCVAGPIEGQTELGASLPKWGMGECAGVPTKPVWVVPMGFVAVAPKSSRCSCVSDDFVSMQPAVRKLSLRSVGFDQ